MVIKSKNTEEMLDKLISRDGYVVSQDNGIAWSLGNLSAFEHKLFDYCVSFIKPDSKKGEIYTLEVLEVLKFFELTEGGENYKRVAKAMETLKYTPLYLPEFKMVDEDTFYYEEDEYGRKKRVQTGWALSSVLGENVTINFDGTISFSFSAKASPYLYKLGRDFYFLQLRDVRPLKGKYELILLKLWQAGQIGNKKTTTIKGTVEEWQTWYLGKEKRVKSNIFKRDMLDISRKQLEADFKVVTKLNRLTSGRKLVGYEMTINTIEKIDMSNSKLDM